MPRVFSVSSPGRCDKLSFSVLVLLYIFRVVLFSFFDNLGATVPGVYLDVVPYSRCLLFVTVYSIFFAASILISFVLISELFIMYIHTTLYIYLCQAFYYNSFLYI
jgi:hypothetical protein